MLHSLYLTSCEPTSLAQVIGVIHVVVDIVWEARGITAGVCGAVWTMEVDAGLPGSVTNLITICATALPLKHMVQPQPVPNLWDKNARGSVLSQGLQ